MAATQATARQLNPAAVPAFRNRLINGAIDFWQRGTSFGGLGYTADRWNATSRGAGAIIAVGRYACAPGEVGGNVQPPFALSFQIGAGTSGQPAIEQRVEGVRTLAGRQVTFSLYAMVTSGTLSVQASLNQVFGTGGSPSATVSTAAPAAVTVTTAWQRFSFTLTLPAITGKTIGTNGDDYLQVQILMPAVTSFTLVFTMAQLEAGPQATDFEHRPPAVELLLCQRFLCKSFDPETVPGTNTGTGAIRYASNATAQGEQNPTVFYPATMRATPTLTFYSPSTGASGKIADLSAAADVTMTTVSVQGKRSHSGGANLTAGHVYGQHFTADAEL